MFRVFRVRVYRVSKTFAHARVLNQGTKTLNALLLAPSAEPSLEFDFSLVLSCDTV